MISAVPELQPYTLPLCLATLALITVVNLRGVRESGLAFVVPTYLFITSLLAVLTIGCVKAAFHNAGHQNVTPATCDCCGEQFVPPCLTCENAFNFAVRELVESGAAALREIEGEMSLVIVDPVKLDEVPAPKWKVQS